MIALAQRFSRKASSWSGGAVASRAAVGWGGAVERALFDREVGVEVDVGCPFLLVSEPQGDGRGVDAGGEQHHRGGVPQLCIETCLERSVGHVAGGSRCLARRRSTASRVSDRRAVRGTAGRRAGLAFAGPDFQHGDGLAGEGRELFLSAFPGRPQVRPCAELQVVACQPERSETRRPVCTVVSSSAWSRRPVEVDRSGLSSSALTSSGCRNVTIRLSLRLVGIASTRAISPPCSGCRSAQY